MHKVAKKRKRLRAVLKGTRTVHCQELFTVHIYPDMPVHIPLLCQCYTPCYANDTSTSTLIITASHVFSIYISTPNTSISHTSSLMHLRLIHLPLIHVPLSYIYSPYTNLSYLSKSVFKKKRKKQSQLESNSRGAWGA